MGSCTESKRSQGLTGGTPVPATVDAPEYLAVEVVYACTHEGALHLEDVLARRTRISFETRDRGGACAQEVAELMAGPLGWDGARTASEVDAWHRRIAAELRAEQLPDDASANAAVLAVS